MVFKPFWSENGYSFWTFWSEIGYSYQGNVHESLQNYFSFQQSGRATGEREREIDKIYRGTNWLTNLLKTNPLTNRLAESKLTGQQNDWIRLITELLQRTTNLHWFEKVTGYDALNFIWWAIFQNFLFLYKNHYANSEMGVEDFS